MTETTIWKPGYMETLGSFILIRVSFSSQNSKCKTAYRIFLTITRTGLKNTVSMKEIFFHIKDHWIIRRIKQKNSWIDQILFKSLTF